MGKVEQGIRIAVAMAIGLLYFIGVFTGSYAEPLLFLAFYLSFTAFRRCCPLSNLFGRKTCAIEIDESPHRIETLPYNSKDESGNPSN